MQSPYNVDGNRTSKVYTNAGNTTTHSYLLDGTRILKETVSGVSSYTLYFYYDASGSATGLEYNGTSYYFQKNLQGDIIRICDTSGNTVVQYTYDAWGKLLSTTGTLASTLGLRNPFRYRSYYFDAETGLYYVSSRYYDPEICRWINADSQISATISGLNLFPYCFNNPINRVDRFGHWPQWIEDAVAGVEEAFNSVISAVSHDTDSLSNILQATSHEANKRPYNGEPGSTYRAPNGDWRRYGPDGKPDQDYDHDDHGYPDTHPHDENGGHYHDWEGNNRGPAHAISFYPVLGGLLVFGSIVGMAIISADDVTGFGIADDFLLGPLGGAFAEGMMLIGG